MSMLRDDSVRHSLVICVHNALNDLMICMDSVRRSEEKFFEIIIVDDASQPATARYIDSICGPNRIFAIRNDIRQGYTKSANKGLRLARGDIVTLLNSDTILPKRWSAKVAMAFSSDPQVGIMGPMSNAASHQSLPSTIGSEDQTAINILPKGISVDQMDQFCSMTAGTEATPFVPLVHGFCMSISRQCLDQVGLLDEIAFPMGYGEETDFCIRAADAGFALSVMTNSYVFHAKSKSYASSERIMLMQQGWQALLQKHGAPRLMRSIRIMEIQPQLARIREAAETAFEWT